MCKLDFVSAGVLLWIMVGWISIPYESVSFVEFIVKGLHYVILGGLFGDCLYHMVKGVIKEIKG